MGLELPAFDDLVTLAQDDPEALEDLRMRLVNAVIASAPPHLQPRLRGLQFRIDMERRRAKTPMAACLKISAMMHETFERLRLALLEASSLAMGDFTPVLVTHHPPPATPRASATILPFPPRRRLAK